MRIVTGFVAVLLMTSQPLSAKAGEAFVGQAANAKPSSDEVKFPTGGASMAAMLASPLPLGMFKPASGTFPIVGSNNISNVTQYGSNDLAVVAQTGAANLSAVTQHGARNIALVSQRGGWR
jgi:Curlin associated repeat